jgi:hypothetical protein
MCSESESDFESENPIYNMILLLGLGFSLPDNLTSMAANNPLDFFLLTKFNNSHRLAS